MGNNVVSRRQKSRSLRYAQGRLLARARSALAWLRIRKAGPFATLGAGSSLARVARSVKGQKSRSFARARSALAQDDNARVLVERREEKTRSECPHSQRRCPRSTCQLADNSRPAARCRRVRADTLL